MPGIGDFLQQWGPLLLQGGLGVTSGILANNSTNRVNDQVQQGQDRLYGLAEREEARRNALLNIFMPMLMRDARFKNPQILGQFMPRRLGQQQPPPTQTQTFGPDLADAPYPYNPGPSPVPPSQDNQVPNWWELT